MNIQDKTTYYFNITKQSDITRVKTSYCEYEVISDKIKGIAIYLMVEGRGHLIKQYNHTNINTAIKYLIKKSLIFN